MASAQTPPVAPIAPAAPAASDPPTPTVAHDPPTSPVPPEPPPKLTPAEANHAAQRVCAERLPNCDWIATFSSLERRSIERVLAASALVVEPQPWGKVIDRIEVVNEKVFAEDNWLQFFNHFHITTRDWRIRNELTIGQGEVWDQDRVQESARRMHDPLYTSVVALLPVKSASPGRVGLLVVTRDVWSLRFNSQFAFQQGALTDLSFSLSENNFLGRRNLLALAVVMDPGSIAIGPLFIDKDFLGQHLDLRFSVSQIITRQAGKKFDPVTGTFTRIPGDPVGLQDGGKLHSEGSDATFSLTRPFWSLATKYGGGASFAWRNAISRSFTGANGDPYELFTDPGSGLPFEYRRRTWSISANVARQWGDEWKHRLGFGYVLSSSQSSLLPSFDMFDQSARNTFAADVLPRSEVISQPFVEYSLFQPRYQTVRNVSTYDLAEDIQLGPSATVTLGQGLRTLGGDRNFTRPSLSLGYVLPWSHDGYISSSASANLRFQSGSRWTTIDNSAAAQIRTAMPSFRLFRIVGELSVETRWHDTQNQFFAIGSDSGLRGYNLNQFRSPRGESSRRVSGQLELRTTPVPWWVLRFGGVVFYEVGGVAASLHDLSLFHDIGFGLRVLVPQTSRELLRFDVAFPLRSAPNNAAFQPHFISGFESYF